MKTSELTGVALDWAVAECEGLNITTENPKVIRFTGLGGSDYRPSKNWSQGGPIIEREKIELKENGFGSWFARYKGDKWMRGETPLIAAMRWLVTDRLGNGVEIPEELQNG